MTVHAANKSANGGNDGTNGERTPARREEEEEQVVRAVDLTNEELKKLLPELAGDSEGMKRIEKIRDVQKNHDQVFEEYIKAKNELEDKFEQKFKPLFESRREIVKEGVNDFWARAVRNCDIVWSNVTEKDAVCMEYLEDLWCENITKKSEGDLNAGSYILHFKFRDNPFFTNTELTKTYAMGGDSYDDFPEARGCDINWKAGKNLTVKIFRKKSKKGKVIVKQEPTDSIFNFFNPPDGLSDDDDMASDIENVVEADVELGEAIRNDLIPRALYYYLDLEEDSEDEDDDGDDEELPVNGYIRA